MKYLIDTHVLIWSQIKASEFSNRVLNILQDPSNEIYFSVISIWEIKIKNAIGKLDCDQNKLEEIVFRAISQDFQSLPLDFNSTIGFNLPLQVDHKDPFDRMLIWQAIHHGYTLISRDKKFKLYEDTTALKVLW